MFAFHISGINNVDPNDIDISKATDRRTTRCLSLLRLLTLAVFRDDGISMVTVSTTAAGRAAVTLTTAQTPARDWITAARCG